MAVVDMIMMEAALIIRQMNLIIRWRRDNTANFHMHLGIG